MLKILYGVNVNKCIDITDTIYKYLETKTEITTHDNIHAIIGFDPYKNIKKYIYIYKNDKLINIIREANEYLLKPLSLSVTDNIVNYNDNIFSFIVLRHVRCENTNKYWNECIRCIRNIYPTNHILIIDDASDKKYIISDADIDVSNNCTVIDSEFPKRGEILPYYYYYKIRHSNKVIMLHDSMFLQSNITSDIYNVKSFSYLWHFDNRCKGGRNNNFYSAVNLLNNANEIHNYFDDINWNGCFGGMVVITLDTLDTIVKHYDIFKMLDIIVTRQDRENFERIIALIFYKYNEKFEQNEPNINNISLYGSIHSHPHAFYLTYDGYKTLYSGINNYPIIKIWSGR